MKKQKKVTQKQIKKAEKKRIKLLDKEWADSVKNNFDNACARCGQRKYLNAAHIFPREIKYFRWDVDNGIAFCPKHHRFHPKVSDDKTMFSAHFNPFAVYIWFLNNYPVQATRLILKWNMWVGLK